MRGVLLALVCLYAGAVSLSSYDEQSPTVDEVTHLVRGLSIWWTGDTRLSYAHPPLANAVAALPSAFSGERYNFSNWRRWENADVNRITRALAAKDYAETRRKWLLGRVAMLAFPIGLFVYLASWGKRRFGPWLSLLPPALLATHPTFLAHATLVTTDAPAACLLTIAACELVSLVERISVGRVARFSGALGLAMVAKFSAAFLAPLSCLVLLVFAIWAKREPPLRLRLKRVSLAILAIALGTTLVVNGAYLFQRSFWSVEQILEAPEPENPISKLSKGQLLETQTPLGKLPSRLIVPLPYSYVFGVSTIKKQTTGGHPLETHFLGETSRQGFFAYFPLLLVLKSPIAFVLLFLFGVVLLFRSEKNDGESGESGNPSLGYAPVVLAVVGGVYLAMAVGSRLNIGVRHALPVIPIAAVFVAAGMTRLKPRWTRVSHGVIALALTAQAVTSALSAPDLLGYFNAFAGGPDSERRISVIGEDWGQDVRALGREVLENDYQPLYYRALGHTSKRELALLGIKPKNLKCTPPSEPAWVALHESLRVRKPRCYAWLKSEPVSRVRNHIAIHRFEGRP